MENSDESIKMTANYITKTARCGINTQASIEFMCNGHSQMKLRSQFYLAKFQRE